MALLARRVHVRQRVVATASVYFQRFYTQNAYAATDPVLVLVTCVYVAAKAEESPVRLRVLCAEAAKLFNEMGYAEFPRQVAAVAEMEMFLLEELDFDLVVFHPYAALPALTEACGRTLTLREAPQDAATSEPASLLQLCWLVVNDMYRTSLVLEHPPYLLAVGALYVALVLHAPTASHLPAATPAASLALPAAPLHLIEFLAGLNVSMPLVAEIVQVMLSHYTLWRELRRQPSGAPNLLEDHMAAFQCLQRMRTERVRAMQPPLEATSPTPAPPGPAPPPFL